MGFPVGDKGFQRRAAVVAASTLLLCYGAMTVSKSYSIGLQMSGGANLRSLTAEEQRVKDACDEQDTCFVSIDPRPLLKMPKGWKVLPAQALKHHQQGVHQMVDDEMWIISGIHGDEALPGCAIFNFDTETYKRCQEPNRGFHSPNDAFYDGYIYMLGAASSFNSPDRFAYRYKIADKSDPVQAIPKKPTFTMGSSCVEHDAKIMCFFGQSQTKPIKYINEVEALDTKEMKWVTDMPAYPGDPIGRFNAGHIKTTLDGKNVVMFFGGLTHPATGNGRFTRSTISLFDLDENKWLDDHMPMPGGLYHPSVVPFKDNILLVGGFVYNPDGGRNIATDTLWEYNPRSQEWTCHAPLPHRIGGAAVHITNNHLYVLGGGAGGYRTTGLAFKLDLNTLSGTTCPPEVTIQTLVNDDLKFPDKMPEPEEMEPGQFAFGANPRY